MILQLIRHGKTSGNLERRYVGVTDESLCSKGIEELKERTYRPADCIVSSPMKRCLETAQIIYGFHRPICVCKGLEEMNFGEFEYHNYEELNHLPSYQAWIDSGGVMAMPGGESKKDFSRRCVQAFEKQMDDLIKQKNDCISFIIHGGTIMAIMEHFGVPQKNYYDWQIKNGQAFVLEVDPEKWKKGIKKLILVDRIV